MFKRKKQIPSQKHKEIAKKLGLETSPFHYRNEMNKSSKKNSDGLFKHKETAYMKWLKDQLDRNETRDKLLSYTNDIRQANERVNYRNQVDRMVMESQRDNLPHNTIEQLQRQRNQFRNLYG